MAFRLFPKEFNFFDLFEKQVDSAREAATLFKEVAAKGSVDAASLSAMEEIEHKGDEATHAVIEHLNKTFITPFDREDIHKLATQLDDIIDMINTIVSRLRLYKLTGVNKDLVQFSHVIEDGVGAVACAVKGLRSLKHAKTIMDSCVEVNRLENVADALRDEVLADLFETEKDPIAVIKWKEIFQDAETVLDVCEDAVNVVESILVKQA